jgi:hypothetical protein
MKANDLEWRAKGLQNLYSAVRSRPAPPSTYTLNQQLAYDLAVPCPASDIPPNTYFRATIPDQNRTTVGLFAPVSRALGAPQDTAALSGEKAQG